MTTERLPYLNGEVAQATFIDVSKILKNETVTAYQVYDWITKKVLVFRVVVKSCSRGGERYIGKIVEARPDGIYFEDKKIDVYNVTCYVTDVPFKIGYRFSVKDGKVRVN